MEERTHLPSPIRGPRLLSESLGRWSHGRRAGRASPTNPYETRRPADRRNLDSIPDPRKRETNLSAGNRHECRKTSEHKRATSRRKLDNTPPNPTQEDMGTGTHERRIPIRAGQTHGRIVRPRGGCYVLSASGMWKQTRMAKRGNRKKTLGTVRWTNAPVVMHCLYPRTPRQGHGGLGSYGQLRVPRNRGTDTPPH
jgi:hypothetical protein